MADLALDAERLLKWAGVLLVVLASAFAVSSAYQRGWFGLEAQLAGAVGLGGALVGTGHRMRTRRPAWTAALTAGGIGVWFFTFTSELFTDLVSKPAGLVAVGVVSVIGWVLAVAQRSEPVGAAALAGSLLGPAALDLAELPVPLVVAWGMAATLGAVALADRQRWYWLRASGLIAAMGWLIPSMVLAHPGSIEGSGGPWADRVLVSVAAVVVAALWHWLPSRGPADATSRSVEIQMAALVTPWLVALTGIALDFADLRSYGLVHVGLGLAAGAVAWAIRGVLVKAHAGSLMLGASLGLSIGLGNVLEAESVALGFAVLAFGLAWLARHLDEARLDLFSVLVWVVAAMTQAAVLVVGWSEPLPWGDVVIQGMALIAIAGAVLQHRWTEVRPSGSTTTLALLLTWMGAAFVHLPQGQALVSLGWALVGVVLLVVGLRETMPAVGWAGLGTLALTVGKLMTVDLAEVDTLWRAGLFLVIGLGFLRLGVVLPRLRRPDPVLESEADPVQAMG